MINVEIDGRQVVAREGMMVIEAADEAGIYIPRFCYHKKLSIAANCRMCLVEIERVAKEVPACATPVTDGMKIYTRSANAIDAQKGVMEFLLINHPLDCPICDQGGECELQDIAMGYGNDVSVFTEKKRVVENKDFGPLISGEMTRCIHCTRCVRFGEEIAGLKELGATGRGEHMEIGTYIKQGMVSELSGNVIDLCPVGALTSKPFRFRARAWEISQGGTIAAHDCIGSNLLTHTFRNEVIRVVPRENEVINETWLSDRDRFSYEGLNSANRLTTPLLKINGSWHETDWGTALQRVVTGISEITHDAGADAIGAIASPSSTVEELYLLQKLLRALGSNNIDHRLMQTDFNHPELDPVYPSLGMSLEELENQDAILLVGTNIRQDQPIAGHRVRKAAMRGAVISVINPVDYDFHFPMVTKQIVKPGNIPQVLAAVLKALAAKTRTSLPNTVAGLIASTDVTPDADAIAQQLLDQQQSAILIGHDAITHSAFSTIKLLVQQIAALSASRWGLLSDGANATGAWLAGAVPHRAPAGQKLGKSGKTLAEMIDPGLAGYLLLAVEPEFDVALSHQALSALQDAKFVVALSLYRNDRAQEYADVILPVTPFTETSGTFVNASGNWQSFEGVVQPRGDARPAWKVLRVLGNLFNCKGFDYIDSREILAELKTLIDQQGAATPAAGAIPTSSVHLPVAIAGMELIPERRMYAGDAIQRHAPSLQQVEKNVEPAAKMNAVTAQHQGVADGERVHIASAQGEIVTQVLLDRRVPDNCVMLPVTKLGAMSGSQQHNAVTISRT